MANGTVGSWRARQLSSPVTVAPRLGQVPAFDGIRGYGVLMVIAVHAAPHKLESFSSILDVFFVVSGFLITTLLLQEADRTDAISLRRFYTRRAWRLLPGLYTLLALVTLLVLVAGGDKRGFFMTQDVLPAGLYFYNFANPLGYPSDGVILYQMWSLSLEEQFYIFGAAMILVMFRTRRLVEGAVALTVLAVAVQAFRATGDLGPRNFWYQRPDAIVLGVVAAIVNSRIPEDLGERGRKVMTAAGWAAFAVVVATMSVGLVPVRKLVGIYVPFLPEVDTSLPDHEAMRKALSEIPDGNYWVRWGFTLTIWASCVLVIVLARNKDWMVARALSVRPIRLVGRMSYTLYLFHILPVHVVLGAGVNVVASIVLCWIGAFALATPVYLFVERRALRRKERFSTRDDRPGALRGAAP